jgi:hypothetical protein
LFRRYQLFYNYSCRRVYIILKGIDEREVHQAANAIYKTLAN